MESSGKRARHDHLRPEELLEARAARVGELAQVAPLLQLAYRRGELLDGCKLDDARIARLVARMGALGEDDGAEAEQLGEANGLVKF